jgi:hypothetical protein
MKFPDMRSFSGRYMKHYAHSTPNGFSRMAILQRVMCTIRGSLNFCEFWRKRRGQKMRKDSQLAQCNFGARLKASLNPNANRTPHRSQYEYND